MLRAAVTLVEQLLLRSVQRSTFMGTDGSRTRKLFSYYSVHHSSNILVKIPECKKLRSIGYIDRAMKRMIQQAPKEQNISILNGNKQ